MRTIEWVIKPTTFCNLRCDYCYEWEGLAKSDKMSLEQWRRLFAQVRTYHLLQKAKYGEDVGTNIVLHGGEPSILPLDYLKDVLGQAKKLQSEIALKVLVQTNLYKLSPEFLSLVKEFHMGVSVSMDVIPGVRRSLTGKETEKRVLENIQRLWSEGIPVGVITVLAAHTAPHVERIYDFWADRFVDFRILPLFSGPTSRPSGRFELPRIEIVRGMCRLFDRWMETGCRVSIAPLHEWRSNVIRKMLGIRSFKYDRSQGERTFVVAPSGDVTHANEHASGHEYWNVFEMSAEEMLGSDRYRASVQRTEDESKRICSTCEYFGACNGLPAHDSEPSDHERCAITYDVQRHIEAAFRRSGLDERALQAIVRAGRLPMPPEMCAGTPSTRRATS